MEELNIANFNLELYSTQQVVNNTFITGEVLHLKKRKLWKLYLKVMKNSLHLQCVLENL